jgi:hypothetical protein
MKRIKSVLRVILLKLPGGKWFYHKIYLPRVLKIPNVPQQAVSQPTQQAPSQAIPNVQSGSTFSNNSFYQSILEQDLALQEQWTLLLKDTLSHLKFLEAFLQGSTSDQEARQRLEEYYRHHKTLILTFEALLARQESQISWLRTILSGPYPVDTDRVQKLEKVIQYLVEIAGDAYARRPHWEHQQ